MARRAAAKQSPESKKEQNRINQRAFRKRQRQQFDEMRAQLASYEASRSHNSRPQAHETKTDHEVQDLPPTVLDPPDTVQANGMPPSPVQLPTQSDLVSYGNDALDATASSEVVDPGLICNALAIEHDARSESQSMMFNDVQLWSENSSNIGSQLPQAEGCSCLPDTSIDQTGNVALTTPVDGAGTAMYYPPPTNNPDPLASVTADFVNAQHSAFRSAEWYAKAAEVGITVAKIRYNAWLASSSLWPQYPLDDSVVNSVSSTVGMAGPGNFASDLTSAASAPQPLSYLHAYNQGMSQVW